MVLQFQRRRDAVRPGLSAGIVPADVVRPRNPFAAVSVRPCADRPCNAVLQIAHQRFLAVRAPSLPVAGCDRGQCGCRYIRHTDRRAPGGDRRDQLARFGGLTPTLSRERRGAVDDRRKNG
jgi:hypothetical protein